MSDNKNFNEMSDAELDNYLNTSFDAESFNTSNDSTEETYGSLNPGMETEEAPVSPGSESDEEQPVEDTDEYSEEDSTEDSTEEEQLDQPTEPETDIEDTDTEGEEEEDETTDSDENSGLGKDIKLRPVKANGKEYEVKSLDELYQLASAGIGVQKKFQSIAKYRKEILAAEQNQVDLLDAINLAVNLKENPKATLATLAKQMELDPMELDLDGEEIAPLKTVNVTDSDVAFKEVIDEIGDSPYFENVKKIASEGWDEQSRTKLLQDPSMLKALHDEFIPLKQFEGKSMWEMVYPEYEKIKLYQPGIPDLQAYGMARNNKLKELQAYSQTVKTEQEKVQQTKAVKQTRKKKASPTVGRTSKKGPKPVHMMTDAELEKIILGR